MVKVQIFLDLYSHTHTCKILQKYFGIFVIVIWNTLFSIKKRNKHQKHNTFLNKQGPYDNVCVSTIFSVEKNDIHIIAYSSVTYL